MASLIVPGFGAPLMLVEADLEVTVLLGGTLFSTTTADGKVGDLLDGLDDACGLGV